MFCLVLFFLNSQLGVVLFFVILALFQPEATCSFQPFFFVLALKKILRLDKVFELHNSLGTGEDGGLVTLCLDP